MLQILGETETVSLEKVGGASEPELHTPEVNKLFISPYLCRYVAEPDHVLHLNGFYNGKLRKMIQQLDELFGYFIAKLQDTGLEDQINVILTADHGHAEIEGPKHVMCVRDYITEDGYDIGDHMIYPNNETIALEIYNNLTKAVEEHGYKVRVYLKEKIPERLHYSHSSRIGRIVIEPEIGWAASLSCKTKKLLDTYSPGKYRFNSSTHGMDPDRKEMRALLVIGGPSVLSGKRVEAIPENIGLYPFMCYILDVPAAPHNASMEFLSESLRVNQIVLHTTGMLFEWITFFVLIIPSACVVILFMIYACRHTILAENPTWAWTQKGYRPLVMNPVDIERMSLLPKSISEFTDPKFWRSFFASRKSPFEWYGDYEVLGIVLEKYLKSSDNILQLGCGNSQLASQMYDNGFRTIQSIDTDMSVIEEQRLRNRQRPELVFLEDNATSMSFADDSFTVAVDKGTLDALLPPETTPEQCDLVDKMFAEVDRVLKVGGRYLIITLAQQHIVKFWIEYFTKTHRFLLRVHEIENRACGFPMPVFLFIATKLRNAMSVQMPIELCRASCSRVERFLSHDDLQAAIVSEQELSQFVHL
ncbi:methyltransferase domain protein, partial [Oesophagostomum dentatum]